MSDFDTAVTDMTEDLLSEAGSGFVYSRGTTTATVTLRKSVGQSQLMESGDGLITEVRPVDFIGLTSDLPFAIPKRGDIISDSSGKWEVMPTISEKVFRQISKTMTRIHAQKVK